MLNEAIITAAVSPYNSFEFTRYRNGRIWTNGSYTFFFAHIKSHLNQRVLENELKAENNTAKLVGSLAGGTFISLQTSLNIHGGQCC